MGDEHASLGWVWVLNQFCFCALPRFCSVNVTGHLAQLIDKQAKNIKALALLRHARARDGDEHASLGWVRVLIQFCFCAFPRYCSVNVTGHLAQLIDKQAKTIKALALLRHARVREWFPRRQLSAVSRKQLSRV